MGFVPDVGTEIVAFYVRHRIENSQANGEKMYVAFIDLEKAYDNLSREAILTAWEGAGYGYNTFVENYITGNSMKIRTAHGHTRDIYQLKGLRQGGMESPFLFNLVLSHILMDLNKRGGQEQAVAYADDLVLFASNLTELQDLVTNLECRLKPLGLSISAKKI